MESHCKQYIPWYHTHGHPVAAGTRASWSLPNTTHTHTHTHKEGTINIQKAKLCEVQLTGEKSSTVKLKSSIAAEETKEKDKRIGFKSHQ